ncbi:hypothetical protein GGI42DRAFT_222755 [Trichoderma sp. SZMC 28013]
MSANIRESYHCFIYGPQSFFVYGLLALSVFCTFLGFIPSLGTPLCFHSTALDRVLGVFLPSFGIFDKDLQHHEKRWGKMTAREAFSERDFAWFASALRVSFWALDTIYETDKMEDFSITWTRHLLTDRVLLHLGQDWKSERASGFCSYLSFFYSFLTKT